MRFHLAALIVLTLVTATWARSTNVIYFSNDTDSEIITAIVYLDGSNNWVANGYWTLEPGDEVHVANSYSRKVFVWARDLETESEWKGDRWYTVLKDGKKRPFRSWDTGAQWGEYTYSFHY